MTSLQMTKLGGVADAPEGCAAIRKGVKGLEKWANRNCMNFNNGKCKALQPREE